MIVKPAVRKKTYTVAVKQAAAKCVGFPKIPGFSVQVGDEIAKIIRSGVLALPASEIIKEILVSGQVFQSGDLKIQQKNMMAVQVDGSHGPWFGEQIVQSIAAAGRYGQNPRLRS